MFTLCGQVANVYVQPAGVSKKTGEAFDQRDKVQILGHIPLQGGGTKLDLVTLNVEDARGFQAAQGKPSVSLLGSTRSVKPLVISSRKASNTRSYILAFDFKN